MKDDLTALRFVWSETLHDPLTDEIHSQPLGISLGKPIDDDLLLGRGQLESVNQGMYVCRGFILEARSHESLEYRVSDVAQFADIAERVGVCRLGRDLGGGIYGILACELRTCGLVEGWFEGNLAGRCGS